MKLTRFVIEKDYGNYSSPAKLVAQAEFQGPFGSITVKLSEGTLAGIIERISEEATQVARSNAHEVVTACRDAAASTLALTHEAEAS